MATQINVDLLVIGGGVNGAGIARDAAGRGLAVMLCEQGDLAGATSSASSKLIHGGLRYLEYYQFRFVREALLEREVLLGIAPHIVWPARFILPHDKGLRPALVIEAGLFLYDWLARRNRLGRSRRLDLRTAKEGAPLKDHLTTGFTYSDCRVDDARLVVLNAVDARERGASIRPRTRCVSAKREQGMWQATLLDLRTAATTIVTARALVNAAGPWAAEVLSGIIGHDAGKRLRLVKGSHIVVPRIYEGDHCYVLQNEDRRVIFVIPYETDYSLIGTTEIPFEADPSKARISAEEISYLCAAVSRYFRESLRPRDAVEGFSGVRPLYDDGAKNASAATRDYVLDLDASEPLPGGDMEGGDFDRFLRTLRGKYPWLDAATVARLARAYGTRVEMILGKARRAYDLGVEFGAGLFQAEIDYLIGQEFALTAEDILWRRSKRGLHLSPAERAQLGAYVDEQVTDQRRKTAG
jgi:glycerol-3-phosphate dehydrogenase